MATSDSDDFESADEEIEFRVSSPRTQTKWAPKHSSAIDSDSDDDNDYISQIKGSSWSSEISDEKCTNRTAVGNKLSTSVDETQTAIKSNKQTSRIDSINLQAEIDKSMEKEEEEEREIVKSQLTLATQGNDKIEKQCGEVDDTIATYGDDEPLASTETAQNKLGTRRRERPQRQQKQKEPHRPSGFGATKLGVKITPENPTTPLSLSNEITTSDVGNVEKVPNKQAPIIQECWEFDDDEATKILQRESLKSNENAWHKKKLDKPSEIDELVDENVPEELKSDKKFKELFNNDGWEGFVDEDKIIKDFDKENAVSRRSDTKPVDKTPDEMPNAGGGWSSWGSWGVASLLNTASAGVSTLTSHVTHGLTLLEESIGAPDPAELVEPQLSEEIESIDDKSTQENHAVSFGFSNLMSGVSSITKLVESTGTKVITGGLGTLETIGKKTMEVLQEGDPGLKKKRAFFMNEMDKPILSQMLREAKEKADAAEKSVEEKQQARKVHFETLFDDFQGLVHLEALEMLSKQCNMKIQQRLVTLEADDMISIQETLDEVKELCDLGDEDDEENEDGNLEERLKLACVDLGVEISCEKLYQLWEKTRTYVSDVSDTESTSTANKEVFQNAISSLAEFTAYCVERFHKTAELLLIKKRRSTVNEADALVQLTKILSGKISDIANLFSKCLNERTKKLGDTNDTVDITTIFLEATNASSYIQDAFRLLIPILQVGAI